jgi:hypothetical protein
MAETLQQYPGTIVADDGIEYDARACGAEMPGGMWQVWIEFVPVVRGKAIHTARETTQPNRTDAVYWAGGLSRIYLEGALRRAKAGPIVIPRTELPSPIFNEPAPRSTIER